MSSATVTSAIEIGTGQAERIVLVAQAVLEALRRRLTVPAVGSLALVDLWWVTHADVHAPADTRVVFDPVRDAFANNGFRS